jgi:hypothetical protein
MKVWVEYNVFRAPSAKGVQIQKDLEGSAERFQFRTAMIKGGKATIAVVRTVETSSGGAILRKAATSWKFGL